MPFSADYQQMEYRLRQFSAVCGGVVAAIGGYFFVAWVSGAMTWLGHHIITMKTNASLCLFACGLSLLLTAYPGAGSAARRWARIFAAISLIVGGLTFLEIIFSADFGIDQLIAAEPPGGIGLLRPNRMGPPGAVSFTLGGVSLLLLLHGSRPAVKTAQSLAAVICVIALLGMLGYLFGAEMLYGAARYTVIAWQTTVANFILSMGLLAARPAEGLMAPVTASNPGGAAIRRLMPYAMILPVLFGWLRLQGERHGLYGHYFGTAILVLALASSFVILVYRTGVRLGRSAEALQRTQSLLLEAEALSHTGAWEWDLTTDVWTFSDEWQRLHGVSNPAIAPGELLDIAHPADREAVQAAFANLRGGIRAYDLEHRIVRQDTGAVRTVRARGQFVKDRTARVVRAYGFVQDVTEQKMAEEEARIQHQLLESVIANMPVGVILARADDLRIILANSAYRALAPGKEMTGRTLPEVWSEVREGLWEAYREVAESGVPNHAADERFLVARVPGGPLEERYASWSCIRVSIPGRETALLNVVWETTDRKRAEEALKESEAKFRATFELAAVGMGRVGFHDARWIDVNPAFCRMLGYPAEFMRATPWTEITHPEDMDLDLIPFRQMAAGELETYTVEKRFIHREGHPVWARLTLSLVRDREGRPDYEIAVIEDITQRKRAEEELRQAKEDLEVRVRDRTKELAQTLQDLRVETAERFQAVEDLRRNEQMLLQQGRLAAMGEMLANISHQWRQPLNVLGLILQDLERRYDKGGISKELLEATVARSRQLIAHMSQTIDDFRSFLNPQRARLPFDVREVVEKAVSMVGESLRGVDLRIVPEESTTVEGFRNEYAQVVMNILMNARDAFRERNIAAPRLTIRIFRGGGRSVVTIADNAGGIPVGILDKIFDPYFTTKAPDKGTGIGLFMSKNIIEKSMGGKLTVRNTGEGAEFRIQV